MRASWYRAALNILSGTPEMRNDRDSSKYCWQSIPALIFFFDVFSGKIANTLGVFLAEMIANHKLS